VLFAQTSIFRGPSPTLSDRTKERIPTFSPVGIPFTMMSDFLSAKLWEKTQIKKFFSLFLSSEPCFSLKGHHLLSPPEHVIHTVDDNTKHRRQYMARVLAVHGLCTHSTWLLYSQYMAFVLIPLTVSGSKRTAGRPLQSTATVLSAGRLLWRNVAADLR